MTKTLIVYSDYICPYCYLGKVAIDAVEKEGVKVEWRTFLLHPDNPPKGIDLDILLGDYNKHLWPRIKSLCKEFNLPYKQPPISSKTQAVHELGEYAKEKGCFKKFHDEVFHAYYAENINIGLEKELLKIAEKAGLSKKECQEVLKSGKFRAKIEKSHEEAINMGIHSIPTIVIGNEIISGMQSVEGLKKLCGVK